MLKKFIRFFKIKALVKKSPCGKPEDKKKKKFLKNISKGHMKKGPAKGTDKKWSWMVSLYRPWQDPIGQGHGEWNGNRERLYGMAMGLPGKGQNSQK